MHPYTGRCPICGQAMTATRLHCRGCDSTLEGQFALNRFAALSAEQASFLETFVRCQGKLSRVEDELNLSYPTVRSRLYDVIRALGFEIQEEPPAEARERSLQSRQTVLDNLATGKISAEEAVALLQGARMSATVSSSGGDTTHG